VGFQSLIVPAKVGFQSLVIPAKAGIHLLPTNFLLSSHPKIHNMDPRFRGDDGNMDHPFARMTARRLAFGMTTSLEV